jgi:hypothetical protein
MSRSDDVIVKKSDSGFQDPASSVYKVECKDLGSAVAYPFLRSLFTILRVIRIIHLRSPSGARHT